MAVSAPEDKPDFDCQGPLKRGPYPLVLPKPSPRRPYLYQQNQMKLAALALLSLSLLPAQETVKEEIKDAGAATKKVAVKTGRGTSKVAKKTAAVTVDGAEKTGSAVKRGTMKVVNKTVDVVK